MSKDHDGYAEGWSAGRASVEDKLDALKAENERLQRLDAASESTFAAWRSRAIAAERALAERAGGVKVKALEWEETLGRYPSRPVIDREDFDPTEIVHWAAGLNWSIAVEYDPFTGGSPWTWVSGGKVMGHFDTVEAAKDAAQADYERRILSALTTEPAAPAATETRRGKSREDLHKHEPDIEPDFLAGEQSGKTSPGAPEGRQEAAKLCAICGSPHDNDLLSDICVGCETDAPWRDDATRPAEQAVTEAQITAMVSAYNRSTGYAFPQATSAEQHEGMRAALKAAMKAGRHG